MISGEVLVEFKGARKTFYERGKTLFSKGSSIFAMDDVNLPIKKGEILGLVGESGSGKTTLGLASLKLLELNGGSIDFDGSSVGKLKGGRLLKFRSNTQMIFQDPFESLNPLLSVYKIVSSPLDVFRKDLSNQEKLKTVGEYLEKAGLYPAEDFLFKSPAQLSGGQRQRVGIARAMVNNPKFIVADEPVSMLDVSLRADVLNLLKDINRDEGTTMLFISHDIIATKYTAQRIAVMHLGQIVEIATSSELLKNPMHPYSKILLKSVPDVGSEKKETDEELNIQYSQDIKNTGKNACSFHQKCPFAMERCGTSRPEMIEVSDKHSVACFLY